MSTYIYGTTTGTVNGVNSIFTLGSALPTTVEVYVNGDLLNPFNDYILSTGTTTGTATATISFIPSVIPQSGDALVVAIFNQ